MDFTFNIFLQLFISNVQVVTNMSSGVTSNSKYTTYGSLRIGGQILSNFIGAYMSLYLFLDMYIGYYEFTVALGTCELVIE